MTTRRRAFLVSLAFTGAALFSSVDRADADQVFFDDLIVIGSECVGQDCSNGENFGFDTVRLKENNLRIRAFDTSNSASFPTNDWQITFNESSNGGANKFSIDDLDGGRIPFTIEAGAPNHSLFVEDGGRIGFGTSTPVVELHSVNGDTPTLRLEQNGSSGFTPQTWDLAGNEVNFFVRDVTHGSDLVFRIFADAGDDLLTLRSGRVGVATDDPQSTLHVIGDATITGNVSMGSSREMKNDLGPVDGGALLNLLSELPIHSWRYLDEPNSVRHIGPMAEDFHATFGLNTDPRHLSIVDTTGLALAAVKELHNQLQARDREIEELRQRLLDLEDRLEP